MSYEILAKELASLTTSERNAVLRTEHSFIEWAKEALETVVHRGHAVLHRAWEWLMENWSEWF